MSAKLDIGVFMYEVNESFERTARLFGADAIETLSEKKVIVFGVGGVGGYVCEALCRSGVGTVAIVDNDSVARSNINRQIIAATSTLGRMKVDVMRERLLDINPSVCVKAYPMFYLPENADAIDLGEYDYIVDAVDTVSAKLELCVRAAKLNIPIISSMGTGNKTDPSRLCVCDISKTHTCSLARVMRRELKARGINRLKVVFSDEEPMSVGIPDKETSGKRPPASCAFVPPAAGLMIAREVVLDLISKKDGAL